MLIFRWAKIRRISDICRGVPGVRRRAVVADYLYAIPNGGKRDGRTAKRLQYLGVKAGVSDMFLAIPRGSLHGLYIELKAERGNVTELQDEWIALMREMGYGAVVCYGAAVAIDAIEKYLRCLPFGAPMSAAA